MVKPETPRGRASSPHEFLGDMAMIRTKQLLMPPSQLDALAMVLTDRPFVR
jgi:hypothetical protein